jgi:hypothetical protein
MLAHDCSVVCLDRYHEIKSNIQSKKDSHDPLYNVNYYTFVGSVFLKGRPVSGCEARVDNDNNQRHVKSLIHQLFCVDEEVLAE